MTSARNNLELKRGQQDRMSRMATGGMVVSTDPERGTLRWRGVRGGEVTAVSHPYIGPTSWFRINPERGTKVLVSYRGENLAPYVSAYVAEDIDGTAISTLREATNSGKFWLRVLNEGEFELTSPGNASTTWLRNGNLELRGGAVTLTLSNTDLELHADAPVHRRTTLDSKFQELGDEERFGVVTRASPLDRTQHTAVKVSGEFAKEYIRHLTLSGLSVPAVDHREGLVIDDSGMPVLVNGAKLRVRTEYGTVSGQKVSFTMDESGNVNVLIPQCDTGLVVQTMNSDLKFNVGKDLNVIVAQSAVVTATSLQVNTSGASSIKLGGSQRLLTEGFSPTLAAAAALPAVSPAAAPPELATAVNAIVAYLKTMAGGFSSSLTVVTVAG